MDSTVHAQAMVSWTLYGNMTPGKPRAVHITDCCSLVQHLRNLTPKCVEKRIAIDTMAFREMLTEKVIEGILWRDTKVQLADSLTKLMNAERLYQALSSGVIDLENPAKLSIPKKSDAEKELETKLAFFCSIIQGADKFLDQELGESLMAYRC